MFILWFWYTFSQFCRIFSTTMCLSCSIMRLRKRLVADKKWTMLEIRYISEEGVLSNDSPFLQMAMDRDGLRQLRLFLGHAVRATEVTKAGKCQTLKGIYILRMTLLQRNLFVIVLITDLFIGWTWRMCAVCQNSWFVTVAGIYKYVELRSGFMSIFIDQHIWRVHTGNSKILHVAKTAFNLLSG